MSTYTAHPPFAIDPLIAEANRRARKRRASVLAALVMATAVVAGLAFAVRPSFPAAFGSGANASRNVQPTGDGLARLIYGDGGFWAAAKVTCAGRRACAITWHDTVSWDQSDWLAAFPEILTVRWDDRLASIRHFTVRIVDPHAGRVASFACALRHLLTRNATRPSPRDLGCVATRQTL